MTYLPDMQQWAVQAHHVDGVDVVMASPAGVNHLGFNEVGGQWMHLRPSGPHGRITAGEAVMLRPADIDVIIKVSWNWARSHPGDPRGAELSDEIGAGAKAALMHFAQAATG